MTNDQIKINRVDLHKSCPIAQQILRLECQLEDQMKYTADLEEDIERLTKEVTVLRGSAPLADRVANEFRDADTSLKGELRDKDNTIENLRAAFRDIQDENSRLEGELRDKDNIIENLGAAFRDIRDENSRLNGEFYKARVELGHLLRLKDSRARLLSDLRSSLTEILKGIGE